MGDEFVTMREAQQILGVSKFKMWQLVRDGELTAYQSPVDRRQKLIRRSDLEALRRPAPIPAEPAKKAAAWSSHAAAGKHLRRRVRMPESGTIIARRRTWSAPLGRPTAGGRRSTSG